MPTCAGSSKEPGIPCLCTSFIPRPPPKVGKCEICGHRRSSHVDNPPGSNSKYLSRLLKNIDATAVHEEARKETNQGFRPQQSSSTVALPDIGSTPPLVVRSMRTISVTIFTLKGQGQGKGYSSCISSHCLRPELLRNYEDWTNHCFSMQHRGMPF